MHKTEVHTVVHGLWHARNCNVAMVRAKSVPFVYEYRSASEGSVYWWNESKKELVYHGKVYVWKVCFEKKIFKGHHFLKVSI